MNELTTPLGLKSSGGRRFRLPLGAVAVTVGVSLVGGLALWPLLVHDPHGGEPFALVPVEATVGGVDGGDITTVGVRSGAGALLPPVGAAPAGEATGDDAPGIEVGLPGGAPADVRLAVGADPDLVESSPWGALPRVAADGRRPLDVYARPVPGSVGAAPKIAVIVGDLGLSQTTTQEAIGMLPAGVTLAFAPYGASLDRWASRARQTGHELLLQIPLEPFDYPDNDPGPNTLLTGNGAGRNLANLHKLMAQLSSYVGLLTYMGGKFTADAAAFGPVLAEVKARGLMYVDDGVSARSLAGKLAADSQTPFAKADVVLDGGTGPDDMTGRFAQLEQIARGRGVAVGIAGARPTTVDAIAKWAKALDSRGIILVPISAARQKG